MASKIKKNPEKIQTIIIHTDGGSRGNPGPAAAACVIEEPAGNMRLLRGKYLGTATNNVAEYQGVILAYEELSKLPNFNPGRSRIQFNLDSSLVVNQLSGRFKVKDPNIRELIVKIREYETKFTDLSYKHIPREKNFLADKVVNETLDKHLK